MRRTKCYPLSLTHPRQASLSAPFPPNQFTPPTHTLMTDWTERPDWLAPLTWSTWTGDKGSSGRGRIEVDMKSIRGPKSPPTPPHFHDGASAVHSIVLHRTSDPTSHNCDAPPLPFPLLALYPHLEPQILPQRSIPHDTLLRQAQDLQQINGLGGTRT